MVSWGRGGGIWDIRGNWWKFHDEELVVFTQSGRLLYPTSLMHGGMSAGSDIRYLSDKITTLYIRGAQISLKKSSNNLKVSGVRRLTWNKFHTEEPQILGAGVHNFDARLAWGSLVSAPLVSTLTVSTPLWHLKKYWLQNNGGKNHPYYIEWNFMTVCDGSKLHSRNNI